MRNVSPCLQVSCECLHACWLVRAGGNGSTCFSSKGDNVSLQRTSITTTYNFLVILSSIESFLPVALTTEGKTETRKEKAKAKKAPEGGEHPVFRPAVPLREEPLGTGSPNRPQF